MALEDGEFRDDECGELLKWYIRHEKLGHGGQGQVYLLSDAARNRHRYAGKMFKSESCAERETRILDKLRPIPGVVFLHGLRRERKVGGRCFGTMVMELCGPSLRDLAMKGPLREEEVAEIVKELAETLKGVHSSGVVHRDLKLENVFTKLQDASTIRPVIGDFGVATDDAREMSQSCGTEKYMAPELIFVERYGLSYTKAVDVWGLGVIAYELLKGYQRSNLEMHLLREGEFQWPANLSPEAKNLIMGMLDLDPRKRLTLDQVINHPWILENCSTTRATANITSCCGGKRSTPHSSHPAVKKLRVV
ncbi:calcium/calmodulin-dependent protein kinase type 1 [Selaginella moellendorffii]|nr:calcium/calmodulin-dependent protein kinase type 1 [Selaginella moellendorffii]|eukprot:XP_002979325.2 calcium/calmodulin-dependent protein kinase type 1 [Selaginella moellendorffii]